MRIGALFAGYGGLDLAVREVLGGGLAWYSEIDKGACKILAHRFPGVPNLGDIKTVDWTTVEPVDVLTGGFPCQDVSTAGKRAGMHPDTRSGLWSHMAYAIDVLRPALVVAENVRGLLSAEAHSDVELCPWCVGDDGPSPMRALGAVLADLADIGYDAQWHGVRAADVGAPHGRFREFITAHPNGGRREQRHPRVRNVQLPDPHGSGVALLPTPAVNDMGAAYTPDEWDAWTAKMQAAHGNGNGHGKSLSIEAQRLSVQLLPTPVGTDANGAGAPQDNGYRGTSLTDATVRQPDRWGEYAAAVTRWEALTRPAPAPTIPDGKDGAHRLNPAFSEWMMGVPAGWITDVPGITRAQSLRAAGNGVVPQQAAHALRVLLAVAP